MSSQDTVKKLRQMRLPVIAEQYEIQISDPSYNQLSFEERFNELIDMEYESRVNHTITKYIKDAHFYDSTASIEDINYNPDRKLNRSQMEELATNNYIERGLNIIFVGASGCGKTWLSNALGVHACRNRKTVLYIRLPELFSKFEEKRIQGKYNEYLKRLGKYDLLIIDEFLLKPTNESERSDLLELMEVRCNRKSTIFCISSAQARVRLAEINLKQAQVNYGREEQLYKKQLVSADEFDKVKQSLQQAKEEKVAALDALEVVRDGVSKSNASASSTLIRSTISGIILDIPVKVGNSVILANTFNDGTTIASVANMNDLIFRGNIDETEVGNLVVGMPMKITIGAMQDLKFDADLEYISPKAVENNGANQFEVKAAVRSVKGGKIRSGYSANAEIVLAKAMHVLTVPESAIEFSGDSTFVYVVKGSGDKKTYERRQVTTGLSDGVNIEIKKGLGLKDKVRGPQIVADNNKDNDE